MKKEKWGFLFVCFFSLAFMFGCGTDSPINVVNNIGENTPPQIISDTIPGTVPDTVPEIISDTIPGTVPDTVPEIIPDTIPGIVPDTVPEIIPDTIPGIVPDTVPEIIPDTIPGTVPDTVPEIIPDTIPGTDENTQVLGQISWVFTSRGVPQYIVDRITTAMDAAVARYNRWGRWSPRTLTVEYNTGVATADGNINGNIRFGANTSYMTECIAMHEIAHTYGVGTSPNWGYPLIQNWLFVGENALAKLREFDGPDAVLNTGGGHFWPYGLNFNREWSETNGDRHAQIVWAMMLDGLFWNY